MTKTFTAATTALMLTALAGAAHAAPPAAPAANTSVVVVDVSRIFAECTACKSATTQLQAQGQQLRTYADGLATPLRTEATSIQAAVKALNGKTPDAALQAREQAFQTRQDQAQADVQQRQQTIQRNQSYAREQIGQKLGPIVTNVMNAHHALIAVDSGATLSAVPSTDVTSEVLAQLNAQLTTVSATAPAAPVGANADGR